ncbi:polyadenylate-binding protein-interacting protein 2-like [Littorina saxatilis]|uniref:Ataxin-2 C-terminal domain-containing protein n=1 Tax=Littorina saxatilis TaxID=31220 RepID=A0AAN9GJT3_9CAEN
MNMRTPPSLLDDDHHDGQPPDPAAQDVDFSEYVWMGEELEEFDRQVEEELWEQAFIEACFEDMLAEEELHWYFSQLPFSHSHIAGSSFDISSPPSIHHAMDCKKDEAMNPSRLNPDAPEFVPNAPGKSVK